MRYEHRELIRSLEDLRRDAVGYLTAFTMTNGAVRHHPSDDSPARKTTLRAAQFFLDFPCDAIGMEQQNKLKSYAINTMCKTVLFDEGGCNHDSGLYDKEWALMIHPVSSTDPALDKELGNCVRIIENLEYLRETGESHEGSREWPHTIFFHLLDRLIVRFKDIGHRPDGIDLDAVQRRVWIRCADELYKQCVLFGADAMGQFDVAKMAFALAPAFNVVPMELMDNALQICADKLADAPNQIFSPYRIVTRDRYFRPLLEEVIAALLDAALVFLKRRRGTIDSIDNITRLVHGVAERALARKRTTTDARMDGH